MLLPSHQVALARGAAPAATIGTTETGDLQINLGAATSFGVSCPSLANDDTLACAGDDVEVKNGKCSSKCPEPEKPEEEVLSWSSPSNFWDKTAGANMLPMVPVSDELHGFMVGSSSPAELAAEYNELEVKRFTCELQSTTRDYTIKTDYGQIYKTERGTYGILCLRVPEWAGSIGEEATLTIKDRLNNMAEVKFAGLEEAKKYKLIHFAGDASLADVEGVHHVHITAASIEWGGDGERVPALFSSAWEYECIIDWGNKKSTHDAKVSKDQTKIDCGPAEVPSGYDGKQIAEATVSLKVTVTGSDEPSTVPLHGQTTVEVDTCGNGIEDSDESDVDCGGDMCGKCKEDKKCSKNEDCISNECTGGTCVFSVGKEGNPADSCAQILKLRPTSATGMYYVKQHNNNKLRVLCNMDKKYYNGGWQLLITMRSGNMHSGSIGPLTRAKNGNSPSETNEYTRDWRSENRPKKGDEFLMISKKYGYRKFVMTYDFCGWDSRDRGVCSGCHGTFARGQIYDQNNKAENCGGQGCWINSCSMCGGCHGRGCDTLGFQADHRDYAAWYGSGSWRLYGSGWDGSCRGGWGRTRDNGAFPISMYYRPKA